MNRKWTYLSIALALSIVAVSGTGCEKLRARDNLNKGVQAFKNAKYAVAVDHFKEAVDLDPTFLTARLYLATAYMSQYIPGVPSPENDQMVKAAKDNFLKVLEQDPKNEIATESLASLNYTEAGGIPDLDAKIKKLDEAEQWYTKLTELNPKKKEAFYSLGVIAWAKWYPALQAARNGLKMKQEDPGPLKDKKVRDDLRAKYGTMIDDGLKNLQTAIDLDGNYDDAMAYVNLLYRERADLADSKPAYDQDIQNADNWLQKALDTRKVKAGALPAAPGDAAK